MLNLASPPPPSPTKVLLIVVSSNTSFKASAALKDSAPFQPEMKLSIVKRTQQYAA